MVKHWEHSPKIWNKTRMPTHTSSTQDSTRSPSHNNQIRKRNTRYPNWKERGKTAIVCRWYDIIYRKHFGIALVWDWNEKLTFSHPGKVMLKILQARTPQYINWKLPEGEALAELSKRKRNKRSNYQYSLDHGESKGVLEKHLLLLHWLH